MCECVRVCMHECMCVCVHVYVCVHILSADPVHWTLLVWTQPIIYIATVPIFCQHSMSGGFCVFCMWDGNLMWRPHNQCLNWTVY